MAMQMNVYRTQRTHSSGVDANIRHAASSVMNAALGLCRRNGDQELLKAAMSVKVGKANCVLDSPFIDH